MKKTKKNYFLKLVKAFSEPEYICTASQSEEGKNIWSEKFAVMKEKFYFFCYWGNLLIIVKKPAKTVSLILLRKRFSGSQNLNAASSVTDLKAKRRVWTFYRDPFLLRSFLELALKHWIYFYLKLSHCWR